MQNVIAQGTLSLQSKKLHVAKRQSCISDGEKSPVADAVSESSGFNFKALF